MFSYVLELRDSLKRHIGINSKAIGISYINNYQAPGIDRDKAHVCYLNIPYDCNYEINELKKMFPFF